MNYCSAPSDLRITDMRFVDIDGAPKRCTLLKIYTNQGIVGYGEVRDAYSAYTQEYHRYQALKAAVKAASDAVSISNDLYKNGLKDFNNVLDAQRSRLQLEEEYVVSRGQITLNLIELYRALGGGLAVE